MIASESGRSNSIVQPWIVVPEPLWTVYWPTKPVRWILSQPAGSSPDATARLISEHLARRWGQGMVVDNRPGGQNVIGAQIAARARPDGYTYFYATTAALVINAFTRHGRHRCLLLSIEVGPSSDVLVLDPRRLDVLRHSRAAIGGESIVPSRFDSARMSAH